MSSVGLKTNLKRPAADSRAAQAIIPNRIGQTDGSPPNANGEGRARLLLVGRAEPPTADSEFRNAVRVQTSLLSSLERTCLQWLAERMPAWVTPDCLTLLGLGAMFGAGVSYALARFWPPFLLVVNFWLAVNWFGDSLDGTLARYRNKQRPRYGFYVDHMVDAFGTLFIMCGLALSGYMSWLAALAGLTAYSLMSINVYLATYTIGTFKLSFYKFSPTELRILLAIGNSVALIKPTTGVFGGRLLFFDVAAVIASAVMGVVTLISVAQNILYLYRAEKV